MAEDDAVPQVLGLIAGDGDFPLEIARAARSQGRHVHAVGFHQLTRSSLQSVVDQLEWLHLGQLETLLASFHRAGVRDAVMAGKVAKTRLYGEWEALRPDARAMQLLRGLCDRRDDSVLTALAELLEGEGIALRPQAELVPQLLAGEGCLGEARATAEQMEDVAFGWAIAKRIAGQDIGQCVVVKQRAVLAVEAIEGTDATVLRAGRLAGPGAAVVKVAKPGQDPRFDMPVIGPHTLESLIEARARLLAFEAGETVVLGRRALVEKADAHGIVLLGVAGERMAESPGGRS